ncbi:MAG: hypothetical protein ACJAUV_001619 [Flavobacteriales bacterium]|jgi:hypothetical protein
MSKAILSCFVSGPSIKYDATLEVERMADEKGRLFRSYVWGGNGLDRVLKKLDCSKYGNDLKLILLQFYLNPLSIELPGIPDIEEYRKRASAIGIPIIINDENFFESTEQERITFLKNIIVQKLNLLSEVIKDKKLDTDIEQLRVDLVNNLQLI